MLFLYAILALNPAQTVGGESQMLHQWFGENSYDYFGSEVNGAGDLNGDGFHDVLIGASFADGGGLFHAGSAYAYSGTDGSLLYQWNGEARANKFGNAAAAAGDVNADGFDDVVIGAFMAASGGMAEAGKVYVYSGADGTLLRQWSGTNDGDYFGKSVAGCGDINQDGFDDLLVGAHHALDSSNNRRKGAAYVFSGVDGSLLYQWYGDSVNDYFGFAVASAQNLDGDNIPDFIVGASHANPVGLSNVGSVYAYSGASGSLLYQWNGAAPDGYFGASLSSAGDLNGDGFSEVVVGANGTPQDGQEFAGAAFAFSGADGSLLYQWSGQETDDYFGTDVAIVGDITGDGHDDVLVGAHGARLGPLHDVGCATLFSGADGAPIHQWFGEHGSLIGASGEYLGYSVAGAGDVNGDGRPDLLVGAIYARNTGQIVTGSATVYSFNSYLFPNRATLSAAGGGTVSLQLNFTNAAAFFHYKILISESGIGTTWYGVDIPLTLDNMCANSFFGNYPIQSYSNLHGMLDSSGQAAATITVPSGMPSGLIGRTYRLAAIANPAGQLPQLSSVSIPLTFTF